MKHIITALFGLILLSIISCAGTINKTTKKEPSLPDIRVTPKDLYCFPKNENAYSHFNKALFLSNQGNIKEAIQEYRKAIEADPEFCSAMNNLARLFRSQGNLDEAIFWYKKSIDVSYANPVAHQNLAMVFLMQGKVNEAISEYELLIKLEPENPEGYYGLGAVLTETGNAEMGLKNLIKAEGLYESSSSPLVADARRHIGFAYTSLNKYDMAISYLEKCYYSFQNDPLVNYYLGLNHIANNANLEEAKKYLQKAKALGFKIQPEIEEKLGL
jgi:tetratricopeptide (TPR) repeat protein